MAVLTACPRTRSAASPRTRYAAESYAAGPQPPGPPPAAAAPQPGAARRPAGPAGHPRRGARYGAARTATSRRCLMARRGWQATQHHVGGTRVLNQLGELLGLHRPGLLGLFPCRLVVLGP